MITKFKLFEFYTGPYKAAGFKHFQETGFAFIIDTTSKNIEKFKGIMNDFSEYIRGLGFSNFKIILNEPEKSNFFNRFKKEELYPIILTFPAVNEYEALSAIDELKKYFEKNNIKIIRASMKTNIDEIRNLNDFFVNPIDITKYINKEKNFKKMTGKEMTTDAYKKTNIGFSH